MGLISDIVKRINGAKPSPVLNYSLCMTTYNLGNTLGNYLNGIAWAIAATISIVIGTKIWVYPDLPQEYKGPNSPRKGQDSDAKAKAKLKSKNISIFFVHFLFCSMGMRKE
mmetsp:Transcript_5764/g.5917  ORF Transcript_5764/g.5917 Transcript_5764/m.5917 type:complete len:111 (-) Transcript_5764:2969-3301(-)